MQAIRPLLSARPFRSAASRRGLATPASQLMRRIAGLSLGLVLALVCLSGCGTTRVVESAGVARWSGLGVSLTLPAGAWQVKEVERGKAFLFERRDRPGRLALMRVPAAEGEPDWLAVKRLFADFPEKREVARWSRPLPSGAAAQCADYSVTVNGTDVPVRVCAVRHGEWTYDLAEWGYRNGLSAEAISEGVAESMSFSESRRGDGGGP